MADDYNIAQHREQAFQRRVAEAMERVDLAMQDTAADQGADAAEQGWHDLVHGVADDCPPAVKAEVLRRNFGAVPGDEWYEDPLTAHYGAAGMVATAAAVAERRGDGWLTCPLCVEVDGDISLCTTHRVEKVADWQGRTGRCREGCGQEAARGEGGRCATCAGIE